MPLLVGNIANDTAFESSISVADADIYQAARGNSDWQPLSIETKEQLLRKATDYMIATYGQSWSNVVRALTIPPLLMTQANAELALIAKNGSLLPIGTRGRKRVKIGPLEVEYDGNSNVAGQFVFVSRKLSALLTSSSGAMVKLVRC